MSDLVDLSISVTNSIINAIYLTSFIFNAHWVWQTTKIGTVDNTKRPHPPTHTHTGIHTQWHAHTNTPTQLTEYLKTHCTWAHCQMAGHIIYDYILWLCSSVALSTPPLRSDSPPHPLFLSLCLSLFLFFKSLLPIIFLLNYTQLPLACVCVCGWFLWLSQSSKCLPTV